MDPHKFLNNTVTDNYFYDPEDTILTSTLEIDAKSEGYLFMLNHTIQDIPNKSLTLQA